MQRVAIIGLGTMGAGMAANWFAKGFEVSVYNRTRAKAEPLAKLGAKLADSPAALADRDIVFTIVAESADVLYHLLVVMKIRGRTLGDASRVLLDRRG